MSNILILLSEIAFVIFEDSFSEKINKIAKIRSAADFSFL